MTSKNVRKKKEVKGDPSVIKKSKPIYMDGSIAGVNTDYSNLNLIGRSSVMDILEATTLKHDYLNEGLFTVPTIDISTYREMYAGVQPLTLATQSGILGINALGENLLEMKINTLSDARNFMVGVNNVASIFSENSGLLHSIESASTIAMRHGRFMTEAIDAMNIPSITRGIELATEYHIKASEVLELSESVTTVLAYGQAVQNQFSILTDSEIYKNGSTILRDNAITLGKISDHIPVYTGSEYITSPFIFEPRTIKTKEVEKALPEVKKELPVKTTEAIELMEYVFDQSTKNDDKLITIAISEAKRAVKNIIASSAMLIQQTTQKVEITSIPAVHTITEKNIPQTNKFPFKIPAGTTWQNITIQFTDSNYVNIQVAGHLHKTGYADMGFSNKNTSKPTFQWSLLSLLAKGGGELPASSSDASDKYKKQKQLLSEKLKDYFSIEPDPFEPYKGGYKTRMTLVPPPEKKDETKNAYSLTDEVEDMFRDLSEE